jgi:hypothetical protein
VVAVAGLVAAGTVAVEPAGALVVVTVTVGAAVPLPPEAQAVTRAVMQASAAPAISRRAAVAGEVIVVSF